MSSATILVVEDTPVNMKLVKFLLSREGYDVRGAASAEEALQLMQDFKPSLILADIQLPGIDGLELTRRLKADPATRGTVVLALTACAMQNDEQRAYAAGCDGYITKPINTRTFPDVIRRYLSAPASVGAPATSAHEDDPQAALLREIRQMFIADGRQQVAKLLNNLETEFDNGEARVTAHRWAGAASQVGCDEISKKARNLEAVLKQNGPDSLTQTREALQQLAQLFAEESIDNQIREPEVTVSR